MADNQKDFQNYIYPFALGCLDKDDFVAMVDYIEAGGDFPWQELGELQNLTALLPSFLNIETPDPGVKDRVARTLYKLKAGKTPEQKPIPPKPQQPTPVQKTGVYSPDSAIGSAHRAVQKPVIPGVSSPEGSSMQQRPGESARPSQTTQVRRRINQTVPDRSFIAGEPQEKEAPFQSTEPQAEENFHLNLGPVSATETPAANISFHLPDSASDVQEQAPETESYIINTTEQTVNETVPLTFQSDGSISTEPQAAVPVFDQSSADALQQDQQIIIQKRGGVSPVIFFIIIIILGGAVGYIYYDFSNKITSLEKNFAGLKENLSAELSSAVTQDRDLVLLLTKKDAMVYSLSGTPQYRESFGRIIYSNSDERGYLQLGSMPEIKANEQKGYQAWVNIGGRSIALNTVPVSEVKNFEYVQISGMPDFSQDPSVQFLVTKEPLTGSKVPGAAVILRGEFVNTKR